MTSSLQTPGKNTYLVGGAVRDELLGLPVIDRDWVVVGSTPKAMLDAGYQSVGKDFPVFLHPHTHEEYALARLERKSGVGYHGFTFNTDAKVTLEEDLSRRDLTINAMAKSLDGRLIDPYNGKADLENRVLRHVSDAFIEDPVRVLRVARFMARFASQGFSVADSTMQLMESMVANSEVDNLVAERVWQEMQRALEAQSPRAFFDTLQACNALQVILPEVSDLYGVPQKAQWHPEIDCYIHTMMVLEQACKISTDAAVRFAAVCHDLGKALTPKDILPAHHGHEERGAKLSDTLCQRLRVPKKIRELSVMCARYHTHCHRIAELKATTIVKTLKSLDVQRRPERFADYLLVCTADARGRLGFENRPYTQAHYMAMLAKVFCSVKTADIARTIPDKAQIPEAITRAQVSAVKTWLADNKFETNTPDDANR